MKKLKPHAVDWAQIDRFLASADKKLASARKILAFDEEACLQQAYEAMLKASLGFMFSHGFRARSQPGHHIAIIDFVRSRLDKKHAGLLFSTCGSVQSLKGAPKSIFDCKIITHVIGGQTIFRIVGYSVRRSFS